MADLTDDQAKQATSEAATRTVSVEIVRPALRDCTFNVYLVGGTWRASVITPTGPVGDVELGPAIPGVDAEALLARVLLATQPATP